ITAIAGSSTPFKGGIIAYDDAVKFALLSVRSETLGEHGAVSEATACEMAEGLRGALGVDLAISATGIAGPDGGSGEKPVGTVWIGIAKADGISASPFNYGNIGRGPVRDHAVLDALRALRGGLSQV
ncbi:MAG: CinA family protein, partial [Hyphomonadaceae bacterium]|nr:CinA family protein [Hyphomonadaceae bacterium]